jgi:acyl-CoA synthetase (AMP-forming)/AMP-acid ligase II
MLLLSAIYARAAGEPSRPALLFAKHETYVQLSYGDLVEELERWARRFLALGLPPRSTIAIVLDHHIDAYAAYLGAMRAGLLPTFLAYPTPKQKAAVFWPAQRGIVEHLEPRCILTYREIFGRVAELAEPLNCVTLDVAGPWPNGAEPLPSLEAVERSETPALLQLSSGTTGARKSVALTYRQIAAQCDALRAALPASGRERILSWAPLYHDMGLIAAFLFPLATGSSVVAIDAFEWLARPMWYFELIERYAITDAWLPNFAMNHLMRTYDGARTFDLSSLRRVVSVAESIYEETIESFARTFARMGLRSDALRCAWGLAENVLLCTMTGPGSPRRTATIAGADRRFTCVGAPLPGVELDVLEPSPEGVGEIVVRGSCAIASYYRNPADTSQSFHNGWLRTGDLGFMRDGELYICGRIKEVLIVHGRNFFASDIETIVSSIAGVKPGRNVAIARFDPASASESVVVLAETSLAADGERDALVREIRSTVYGALGLQVGAVELLAIGELIKTTSGKMTRAENAARFASGVLATHS